jgi:branched-chain amino acid transport system substrate-binding protein
MRILVCLFSFSWSLLHAGVASAEVVKVGIIATSSGGYARFGEQFRQAIDVYQKQHGKTVNGHTIEIVYRDDGGADPAKARQLAEELILREHVQILGGFAWTPNALGVAELITQAKMPTLLFVAAASVITRQSPYFVRTSDTLAQIAAPYGKWAAMNGIKKVVTAIADFAPGIDAEEFFTKGFKAAGGEVLDSMRIPLATTDFAPFYERISQRKPDALFIFGPSGTNSVGMVNTWAARLKPAGIGLLATNEVQELDLPKIGLAALGVVSASYYTETADNALNKALRADLVEMFGKDAVPDVATLGAYDGMHLIYQVVSKLGPRFTSDDAMKVMAGAKFDSPRGRISIDPEEREIVQNIYVRKVEEQNGRLVNVGFATIPMVRDPWKDEHPRK